MLTTKERQTLIKELKEEFGSEFPVREHNNFGVPEIRISGETEFEINLRYIEEVDMILGDIILDYYDEWNLSWLESGIHKDILKFLDDRGYMAEWHTPGEVSIWHN